MSVRVLLCLHVCAIFSVSEQYIGEILLRLGCSFDAFHQDIEASFGMPMRSEGVLQGGSLSVLLGQVVHESCVSPWLFMFCMHKYLMRSLFVAKACIFALVVSSCWPVLLRCLKMCSANERLHVCCAHAYSDAFRYALGVSTSLPTLQRDGFRSCVGRRAEALAILANQRTSWTHGGCADDDHSGRTCTEFQVCTWPALFLLLSAEDDQPV